MRNGAAALHAMAAGRGRPLLVASATGWAAIAASARGLWLPGLCGDHGPFGSATGPVFATAVRLNLTPIVPLGWVLMLAGMMTPLLWQPIGHVRDRSLAHRRTRAVLLFVIGYAGIWMAALALLWPLALLIGIMAGDGPAGLAAGLALALIWQGTPAKARFLRRCHATRPLPAFGLRAEWGSLRFGIAVAGPCVAACWALMLLPMMRTGAPLLVMAFVALAMLSERYAPPPRITWRWPFIGAGALAFATVPFL